MASCNKERIIEDHCRYISDLYVKIHNQKDISILKEMYSYIKCNIQDFFINDNMHWLYNHAIMNLMDSERLFNREYLLDNKFYLDINDKVDFNKDFNEIEVLNYLVFCARKYLIEEEYSYCDIPKTNLWDFNLVNYCQIASEKIHELCDKNGISCHTIKIYPGYDKTSNLFDGIGYHFFNIIDFGSSKYLMDVTYSQFFNKSASNIERIGIVDYFTPKAGCFMMFNEERKHISEKILSNGYIKLSRDVFRVYMDGFTISFRNGLYYDETNDYSYTTSYSSYDYINFLNGNDNQINHEGSEVLGFQKRPLKKI